MDYVIGAAILGTGIYIGLAIAANRDDERMDANDNDLGILYDNDVALADAVEEVGLVVNDLAERLAIWATDKKRD